MRRSKRGAQIAAISYALPARRISNDELAALHPDWSMRQVAVRTGVHERYWCEPGETALDLAVRACEPLAVDHPADWASIDAVLFCTQTPDYWMPPNACLLQDRLKLPRSVAALDFSLACSGFIYGLYLAKGLVVSGMARTVLVVTAETYSKWIHPGDRGPATLFGDGAAATLVTAGKDGIGPISTGTDGAGALTFCVPAGGARTPKSSATSVETSDSSGNIRTAEHLVMRGAAVLNFVKKDVVASVHAFLKDNDISMDSLDLVIPHQASALAIDHLNKTLGVPLEKQFSNIATVGNTVSASIPIALRDAERAGALRKGSRVLLIGFGVGLSWGVALINWTSTGRAEA